MRSSFVLDQLIDYLACDFYFFLALHHMAKDRLRPLVDRYEKHHKYNGTWNHLFDIISTRYLLQWVILLPFHIGLGVNGHSKHRNIALGYDTSSVMSSELETTSFLESDDDTSSRITTTTGRATNLLLGEWSWSRNCHFLRHSSLQPHLDALVVVKICQTISRDVNSENNISTQIVTVDAEHQDVDVIVKLRPCPERRLFLPLLIPACLSI